MRAGLAVQFFWAEVRCSHIDWIHISLNAPEQAALIRQACELIVPGGRLLFTAPVEKGTWADTTTGHECRSLGRERDESILAESRAFGVVATFHGERENSFSEQAGVLPQMLNVNAAGQFDSSEFLEDETFFPAIQGELKGVLGDAAELDGYNISDNEINLFVLTSESRHFSGA